MQLAKKRGDQCKADVWKWFCKLSLEERGNVLLWEDREGTCLLKQMYKKKWTEGEGFFLSGTPPLLLLSLFPYKPA
jgi:hypothetical protein